MHTMLQHTLDSTMDADDLRDLMRSVIETTERLEATHAALQNQVARLQRDLADANARLHGSGGHATLNGEVHGPLEQAQHYARMLREQLRDQPEQAAICGQISRALAELEAAVSAINGQAAHADGAVVCNGETTLDDIERTTIVATLQHHRGHRQRSAQALGIGVRTLGLKLKKWKELKLVEPTL